jgi:two-component system chemotaxis sensor kinase CheA
VNGPDRTLLDIFAAEQAEHLARIRKLLAQSSDAAWDELLRRAHTLKGASRAVGLAPTEALVHRLETLFLKLRAEGAPPDTETQQLANSALDTAEDILAWARGERGEPLYANLIAALERRSGAEPAPIPLPVQPEAAPPADTAQKELVRVDAEAIDDLVQLSTELLAATSSAGTAAVRSQEHVHTAAEAVVEFVRLRRLCAAFLRAHERDEAVEPIRQCLAYADGQLRSLRDEARRLATRQQQQAWDLRSHAERLHEGARSARMTTAGTVFTGFGAMVRALAAEQGKQVDYQAEGLDTQADRAVFQRLKDSVMHLLRNAVSHGIEHSGTVRLRVAVRGQHLAVAVEDDGRGIDVQAVAAEAARRGVVVPEGADSAEVARLLFLPGFSTSRSVTKLSGRGMGLPVVRQAMIRLRGDVSLASGSGGGTVVSLWVPLSISTQHVVFFRAGESTFCLPASSVLRAARFRASDVLTVNGRPAVPVDSAPVPLRRFSEVAGLPSDSDSEPQDSFQYLVVAWNDDRVVLAVDTLLGDADAVVKETNLANDEAGLSAGAVPLEDGSVAVLLNVPALFERLARLPEKPWMEVPPSGEPTRRATVLVVDDSITTRSVEKSILEASGYAVEVAVNGAEALAKIQERVPDLVISDISMPVMDGFELLERIRSSKATERLPVILVTSLESREDQERGLGLGADAYIVKRKFDQRELLETVRQIL